MAKYKSLFKIEGTLDDVNFYKTEDGYQVRTKGGVSKSRIQKDPAFQRTRENNSEFGSSATSGKIMRRAIIGMLANAKDNKLVSRVTQVMTQVKNFDITSPRGKRNVAIGIATPDGKTPLRGFNFNRKSSLSEVLLSDYDLDTATGVVTITDFTPNLKLNTPEGATHVEFSAGFLNLDFTTEVKDLQISNIENLPINGTTSNITLTPTAPAAGTGQSFYFLKVAFFQEINNLQYPLKNGTFNALQILDVL